MTTLSIFAAALIVPFTPLARYSDSAAAGFFSSAYWAHRFVLHFRGGGGKKSFL